MMKQIPAFLGREAAELLTSLDEWARGLPQCPFCKALRGCSHVGRCPVGRVKRLEMALRDVETPAREAARVEIERGLGLSRTPSAGPLLLPEAIATAQASPPADVVQLRPQPAPVPAGRP